jgi:CubicO group peptidase (beta-lactamase class C family)
VKTSTNTGVSWKLGAGGFMSSIGDLASLAQGLLSSWLLTEETRKTAWQTQTTADGQPTEWGLGFVVSSEGGTLKVSHNGSQEKARCRLVIYPQR